MKTLETQAPQNVAALSTPAELDITSIVREQATRKSKSGDTLTTKKGKVSLLTACIKYIKSARCMPEYVTEEMVTINPALKIGEETRIDGETVEKIRQCITSLFANELTQMLRDAKELNADEKMRPRFLAGKVSEKGEISVSLNSSYAWTKDQAKNSGNYRMQVCTMLSNAKKRQITIEQMAGSANREDALAKCVRKIALLQKEYDNLKAKQQDGKA